MPKEETYQLRILFQQNEGDIKTLLDKEKLWKFVTTRPAWQEMLKGVFQPEMKGQ